MPLSLSLTRPRPSETEVPLGTEFFVEGTAVNTDAAPQREFAKVLLTLDDGRAIEAQVRRLSSVAMAFTGGFLMSRVGDHVLRVTATLEGTPTRSVDETLRFSVVPPCRSGLPWQNYPRTQSNVPQMTCAPITLSGLIDVVRQAEQSGKRVHASGSRWSFSNCAMTSGYSVDTRRLRRELPGIKEALLSTAPNLLVHVEAGITIGELCVLLRSRGLALETMGGASGQTLGGAISTGTHGGDQFLPPLADSVLAIHLVGIAGTEFWIEPTIGITNPHLLRRFIVPGVETKNVVYDDVLFNSALVSLGLMGIMYSVVLRVRTAYELIESTSAITWKEFRADASRLLSTPSLRFVQALVSPYPSEDGENLCLLTTRTEEFATGREPVPRAEPAVEPTIRRLIDSMSIGAKIRLHDEGIIAQLQNERLPKDERLAALVRGILKYTPDQVPLLKRFYPPLMLALFPPGTFQGPSFSVMDLSYGRARPASQPGYSFELSFPAIDDAGGLASGPQRFIEDSIRRIPDRTGEFFAGYISMRFTGPTRAYLGMQQWTKTCSIEVSAIGGVPSQYDILAGLYRSGSGVLPHWGQLFAFDSLSTLGRAYPHVTLWRRAYAELSKNFTVRTFENDTGYATGLTLPNSIPVSLSSDRRGIGSSLL